MCSFVVNKSKISRFIKYIDNLHIKDKIKPRTSSFSEESFLKIKSTQGFLEVVMQAYDPFSAAESVKHAISINSAFYRLCDHDYHYDIYSVKCGVYDE